MHVALHANAFHPRRFRRIRHHRQCAGPGLAEASRLPEWTQRASPSRPRQIADAADWDSGATVQLPPEGSAAQISQDILGDEVQVVSAFQNISAELLKSNKSIDCDVLVCGNKKDSRSTVIELIESIGMRAWHAGQLANSAASEALTSVLISINKNHSISHSGIRITGVEE